MMEKSFVFLVLVLTAVSSEILNGSEQGAGSGIQMQEADNTMQIAINLTNLTVPDCGNNTLLTSNGTQFFCRRIPERRCICPSPMVGTGEPPTRPPEPPGGCLVFEPPDGGGFACLRPNSSVIYCSVLCDNIHEFSNTPLSPYHCGETTKFQWMDFTGVTYSALPKCTSFRYTTRPLHRIEYYLPSPCRLVLAEPPQSLTVRMALCRLLAEVFRPSQLACDPDNVFVQCPQTSVTTALPADHPNVNP